VTRYFVLADTGDYPVAIGPVSKDKTIEVIRDEAEKRGWTLCGQAVEMSYREFREGRPGASS
jgi:hypothetical protein